MCLKVGVSVFPLREVLFLLLCFKVRVILCFNRAVDPMWSYFDRNLHRKSHAVGKLSLSHRQTWAALSRSLALCCGRVSLYEARLQSGSTRPASSHLLPRRCVLCALVSHICHLSRPQDDACRLISSLHDLLIVVQKTVFFFKEL